MNHLLESVLMPGKDVIGRLNSSDIEWAFFAGVASAAYGVMRRIKDIDIIFTPDDIEQVRKLFTDFNTINKEESEFALSRGEIELISGHLGYSSHSGEYHFDFDTEMITRRVSYDWKGMALYFLSPEDTIVLKAILRRESNGTEFDIEDIATITKTVDGLDYKYVLGRADKSNATERVSAALESIGLTNVL